MLLQFLTRHPTRQRARWRLPALWLCLLASTAAAAAPSVATPPTPPGRFGIHGMVLFGNAQGLYAMHLAMFHRPHDVQAVLRIHLADPTADARLRRQLQRQPALWTLEPERFDLDRLAPASPAPLQRFAAQLFRGHFERGGHPQLARQQVVVDAVLLFQPLDPAYRQQPTLRYRLIGTGRQRFLLKRLDSRPDADLLLAVTVPTRTPQTELRRDGQGWPTDPRHWSARLSAQQGAAWTVTHVLYADGADLH